MKRFLGFLVVALIAAATLTAPASAADRYTASGAVKLDVLGEWAHPDDDTSIIGPCGVWHQRYDVKCGIIMVTRGEGGGNAVGTEIGPALGLRRENEDRVAHYRSGTVDIFNLDRVDFFYNQSAPADAVLLGPGRDAAPRHADHPHDAAGDLHRLHPDARRRPRQPPAGRPLHLGGRQGRRRPDMFPEQLDRAERARAPGRSRRSSPAAAPPARAARPPRPTAPPASRPPRPTTTRSPACGRATTRRTRGRAGNVQGQPAGQPKIWEQVASRARRAYPTQSRTMNKGTSAPSCSRFGMTRLLRPVPAEREPDGRPTRSGKDDAILYGAVDAGPGRAAEGHAGVPDVLALLQRAGRAVRRRRCTSRRLGGAARGGHGAADRPGRLDGRRRRSRSGARSRAATATTVTFTVTPSARRAVNQNSKIVGALHEPGAADRLHGRRRAHRLRPPRAASSAGATGRSTTTGSRTRSRRRRPARPLGRDPVDGRRRDDHRPGRRAQLVDAPQSGRRVA